MRTSICEDVSEDELQLNTRCGSFRGNYGELNHNYHNRHRRQVEVLVQGTKVTCSHRSGSPREGLDFPLVAFNRGSPKVAVARSLSCLKMLTSVLNLRYTFVMTVQSKPCPWRVQA